MHSKRRHVPAADRRILLSKSARYCTKCKEICYKTENEPLFLGEICHIHGRAPGAVRYDDNYPVDEIDRYTNLIMLCPTCHTEVDKDSRSFTTDVLMSMKNSHESWIQQQTEQGSISPIEPVVDRLLTREYAANRYRCIYGVIS